MDVAVVDPLVGLRLSIENALTDSGAATSWPVVKDPWTWLGDVPDRMLVVTVLGAEDLQRIAAAVETGGGVVALVDDTPAAHEAALAAGATATVARSAPPSRIAAVVCAAASGDCLLPSSLVADLVRHAPSLIAPRVTDEELGWIRSLAQGSTVSGLAAEVGYSEREMFRQLADLYRRMGARNRIDAIVIAARHGLLDG